MLSDFTIFARAIKVELCIYSDKLILVSAWFLCVSFTNEILINDSAYFVKKKKGFRMPEITVYIYC